MKQSNTGSISRIITLGDIDSESINDIIQLIYDINSEDNKKTNNEPIKLIINSYGGEVYSGLALIDVIDNSKTPIHTICHGAAMSMGLVVYVAGHYRAASKYSTFMYHEASYPTEGKIVYHKQELTETERVDNICDSYLISRTKLSKKNLEKIKNNQSDWYFGAKIALEYGIVNEII
jgi:ATP-dependent Clp protease protease subunit